MDKSYQQTSKEAGFVIDRIAGDDLRQFPIERARARLTWYLIAMTTTLLLSYGWILQRKLVSILIVSPLIIVYNKLYSQLLSSVSHL